MKTFFQFGAAALALSASTAFAQAGQGPVGLPATVSGVDRVTAPEEPQFTVKS